MDRVKVQGGKLYTKVVDRLTAFKDSYHPNKGYCINTAIHTLTDNYVVFKAVITDQEGKVLATGHGLNGITKDKSFEKAETVAVGRALAFFDPMYGGESELASEEEMEKYQEQIKDDGSSVPQKQFNGNADFAKKISGDQEQVADVMSQAKSKLSNGNGTGMGNGAGLKDGFCNFKKHKGKKWSEVALVPKVGKEFSGLEYMNWIIENVNDLDNNTRAILNQYVG